MCITKCVELACITSTLDEDGNLLHAQPNRPGARFAIVAVTTLWADEAHYYLLHVAPYTPEKRLAKGRQDPAFRTKPQIALELVERAQAAGIAFWAIVADCFYGDNHALETALLQCRLPHVLARRGAVGRGWAPA